MQNTLNATSAAKVRPAERQAFTLIEMMLVVAVIGILIGGMFRMINAVGQNTQRAETINRLQRLENAISGFYAECGTYPPVPRVCSPDPSIETEDDTDDETYAALTSAEEKFSHRANRAAHSQPPSFQYPSAKSIDGYLMTRFGAYSANQNASDASVKRFQYGLLSFLLPRLQFIGGSNLVEMKEGEMTPDLQIFKQSQWTKYNSAKGGNKQSFMDQNAHEVAACSRWLPHLEGIVFGGKSLLGVALADPKFDNPAAFSRPIKASSGNTIRLACASVFDAWTSDPYGQPGHEIYYYSEPPYQGYRLWSAGPDGKTFPPWIPLESLSSGENGDRKKVIGWIEDDIVRFDSK